MTKQVRVAFFTDSFYEVNGVAHTSRHLEAFARSRRLPVLSVHAGPRTEIRREDDCHTVELARSRRCIPLDDGLSFDPWILRHWRRTKTALELFQPDVIHITGPGDIGALGTLIARANGIPLVVSWHTNLHQYAATRLGLAAIGPRVQDLSWKLLMQFHKLARLCLAPNEELRSMIERESGRPTYLMERGIDTELFHPDRRRRTDSAFVLGYVGRLRPEKNVDALVAIGEALTEAGCTNFKFRIVGDGSRREFLAQNLVNAELTGVLRGTELAEAYASMDLFLFPSWTDTYSNVVGEALASGVPAIVTSGGGPKFLVQHGVTGAVENSDDSFARRVVEIVRKPGCILPMRTAAREWALSRSWERVFDGVWRCYENAAESGLSGRHSTHRAMPSRWLRA